MIRIVESNVWWAQQGGGVIDGVAGLVSLKINEPVFIVATNELKQLEELCQMQRPEKQQLRWWWQVNFALTNWSTFEIDTRARSSEKQTTMFEQQYSICNLRQIGFFGNSQLSMASNVSVCSRRSSTLRRRTDPGLVECLSWVGLLMENICFQQWNSAAKSFERTKKAAFRERVCSVLHHLSVLSSINVSKWRT